MKFCPWWAFVAALEDAGVAWMEMNDGSGVCGNLESNIFVCLSIYLFACLFQSAISALCKFLVVLVASCLTEDGYGDGYLACKSTTRIAQQYLPRIKPPSLKKNPKAPIQTPINIPPHALISTPPPSSPPTPHHPSPPTPSSSPPPQLHSNSPSPPHQS